MNPYPRSDAGLSRNSSQVNWGTKIKGAIQVGHGLGDAIRGSLGAKDFGTDKYTSSQEIAQRGRHEIAQGLARIKGATTMLPPAPLYDRRHSHPAQQYDAQPTSVWHRRSVSVDQRPNPSTAAEPFGKYYEHPYPAEQDHDPGFAGLGAGVDPARRDLKEGNVRVAPAFLTHRPPPASTMDMRYPARPNSQVTMTGPPSLYASSARNSVPASIPAENYLRPPSAVDPFIPQNPRSEGSQLTGSSLRPPPSIAVSHSEGSEQPSARRRRRSFSTLLDRTRKSIHFTGKGKGKAAPPPNEDEPVPDAQDPRVRTPAALYTRSAPPTPPPHQHERALEHAGYDVLSYDAKDVYPHWPTEDEMRARGAQSGSRTRNSIGPRLEPVRSTRR